MVAATAVPVSDGSTEKLLDSNAFFGLGARSSSPHSNDSSSDEINISNNNIAQREKEGKCVTCGQQLYAIKPKKAALTTLFKGGKKKSDGEESSPNENDILKNYRRVPLTIPGLVERGQCLNCGTSTGASGGVQETRTGSPHLVDEEMEPIISSYSDFLNAQNNQQNDAAPEVSSATALYEGPYNAAGKRHGKGKMTWSNNGDVYVGEFVNGDRHGHGTLHFGKDGSEYVGEWRHNQMSGIGTRRWSNGDCYTGDYLAGRRSGEGRFYFSNGDMYVGEFYSDKIHGFGRYYYANGQRFEGYFYDGKRTGKGKVQRTDGTLDVGVYRQDVRVGTGVRWSPDRTETWKLENGLVKKKITVAEAVALDYEMESSAAQIAAETEVV